MRIFLVLILGFVCYLPIVNAASPFGRWTTIDDVTGEKRADVEFAIVNGELQGTIVRRYLQPGDPETCAACPGEFKNKPIQGLSFIWGLKEDADNTWIGGRLIDPQTGKIYRVKITLKEDKLYVRGYIGIPAVGRTQIWVHAKG